MNQDQTMYGRYRDTVGDWQADRDYYTGRYDTEADRDYSRYRDTVGDWENERDYLTGRADTEYERDCGQYMNDLDYWTGLAQAENADYNTDTDRQEAIRQYEQNFAEEQRQYDTSMAENMRQFDATMAQSKDEFDRTDKLNWAKLEEDQRQYDSSLTEEQRQYDTNLAVDYVTSILANGQIPSNELLVAAGLSYEDAQKLIAQVTGGGGGSGNKPNTETPQEKTPAELSQGSAK